MRVVTAQLPDIEHSADKIFVTDRAIVVLDGATAFVPVSVPASTYADFLGLRIRDGLTAQPEADLSSVLAHAIWATATELDLQPGRSPSSAVSILRRSDDHVDVLVLGDSVVVLPDRVLTDDRIDQLNLKERQTYRDRLAQGNGYDDTHRQILRELQTVQTQHRNVSNGYWIAEAVPEAAHHAFTLIRPADAVPWAILATDGAYNPMVHLGLDDWLSVAQKNTQELAEILTRCEAWERDMDPNARDLPRAKRHDDKAIAAVRFDAPRIR